MSEVTYKTIGNKNFMLITCAESGKNIDTQIKMLTSGSIKSLLPVTPTSKNGIVIMQYDITGLSRLSGIIQYGKLSKSQFSALIDGMATAIKECSSYALSANGINLDDDCIYFDSKCCKAMFAYVPTLENGEPVDKIRDMLRNLIAYGKVTHNSLTASVTDIINNPSFTLYSLSDILGKSRAQAPVRPQPTAQSQQQVSRQPEISHVPAPASPINASVPVRVPTTPTPMPVVPLANNAKPAKEKKSATGNPKNMLIIIATVAASILLIVGACFTSAVRLPDGNLDITKVLGVIILTGALDFLLLRKLSPQTANDDAQVQKQKTENKKKGSRPLPPPPASAGPAPFVPPILHTVKPAHVPVQNHAPAGLSRPEPVVVAARASEPAYTPPVQDSSCDETMMFDDPVEAGMLYLQTSDGGIINLTQSPFLLGRDKEVANFVLEDGRIGRKHAEFNNQGDGWVVIDQNSRNHTYLNEICLNPYTPYSISAGDTIRLANMTLWVKGK